ncbi:Calcium/calmodulin-dependent 3',5'-cyclic nucleotide phosphodiesterase 1B, partial [Perkinsus chesapeaki]
MPNAESTLEVMDPLPLSDGEGVLEVPLESSKSGPIRVESLDREYMRVEQVQQEVVAFEMVNITKGLMRFDNDDIEQQYVKAVVDPTLRARIIPMAAALFTYSAYSLAFSEWFASTPYITQWHTTPNIFFNLSWIYHMLSSAIMLLICVKYRQKVGTFHFEVYSQVWLNVGIWVGVLFGNRWRCAKIFNDDPILPFGKDLDPDSLPYSSDADLLLILNGIMTYFCVWTSTRVRLLSFLAVSICMSYGGSSLILGLPETDNPLSQSLMLIILVVMVISGKVSLERSTREQFVSFNISVRKIKVLEHTVKSLSDTDGPTTNFEKAFADIGSALSLLDNFSLRLQQRDNNDTRGGGIKRRESFRRASGVLRTESFTRDAEEANQIREAISLIKDSAKILSRRSAIDRVVFKMDTSDGSDDGSEGGGHEFMDYMYQVLNQNQAPKLGRGSTFLPPLDSLSSSKSIHHIAEATEITLSMLNRAGKDFNLDLVQLQEVHLPSMPILPLIGSELLSDMAITSLKTDESTLHNFLTKISGIYTSAEYHNQLHASQVTSHGEYLLTASGVNLSGLDHSAYLIACVCHDVGHRGLNNTFYVETSDALAIRYNDRSVLEQYHVATAFEVMRDIPECNIINSLTREEKKRFSRIVIRNLIVELILATDMTKHFAITADLRLLLGDPEFRSSLSKSSNEDDRILILKACIKAADIGHTCLPWEQHYELSLRLTEEFFRQGDREKELGITVSPLCDRDTLRLPQSQLGFIDYLVRPFIETITRLDTCHKTDIIKQQLEENALIWKTKSVDDGHRTPSSRSSNEKPQGTGAKRRSSSDSQ